MPRTINWITTYSGRRFAFEQIDPEAIRLCDLAHQLSQVNRFSGATFRAYSVAQHSIAVSEVAVKLAHHDGLGMGAQYELGAIGLLHDAAEAYPPNEVASPAIKGTVVNPGGLIELRLRIQHAIYRRYSCAVTEHEAPELVKRADAIMLAAEFRDLMRESPIATTWDDPVVVSEIRAWGAGEAELRWLLKASQLLPRIGADVEDEIAEAIDLLLPESPPTIGKGYESEDRMKLALVMGHLERRNQSA